jgi:hypothetical protein
LVIEASELTETSYEIRENDAGADATGPVVNAIAEELLAMAANFSR